MSESIAETNTEDVAESARLNPPGAFTAFLIAAAVAYVGMLVFVFAFGMYGDTLTAGVDTACAEAAFQGGKRAEGIGNYDLAVQRYRQALAGHFSEKSREYECGRSLGEVLLRLGRYEESVDTYKTLPPEAFSLPGHWTGYVSALFRAEEYEEARRLGIVWLAKAQAAKDRQQEQWASAILGDTEEHFGKLDEALKYYRMAAAAAPESDAGIRVADVLKKLGKNSEALQELDAFLSRVGTGPLHEHAARLKEEYAQETPAQ